MRHFVWFALTILVVGLGCSVDRAHASYIYQARFNLDLQPSSKSANGSLVITQGTGYVANMRLNMPTSRYSKITGDGVVKISGDKVL